MSENKEKKIEVAPGVDFPPKPAAPADRYDIFGLFFDIKDGKFYPDLKAKDPVSQYTFETGDVLNTASDGFAVNPTQFATEATRVSLIAWLKKELAVKGLTDATPHDNWILNAFFRRVPERQIELHFGEKIVTINAGLLANSIIRGGEDRTVAGLLATINEQ